MAAEHPSQGHLASRLQQFAQPLKEAFVLAHRSPPLAEHTPRPCVAPVPPLPWGSFARRNRCMRLSRPLLLLAALATALPAAAAERSAHELKAREIFAKTISFKTSPGLGQVPAMAEYLAGEFRKGGFPAADVHVLPLGETASLVVRYRGD